MAYMRCLSIALGTIQQVEVQMLPRYVLLPAQVKESNIRSDSPGLLNDGLKSYNTGDTAIEHRRDRWQR